MARVVGGLACSHAPSIAHSYDRKLQKDPMWAPLYDGWEPAKEWLTRLKPDLMVVVYNDHMNRFFFDAYPSFALGAADKYPQADEGWGTRDFPDFPGDAASGSDAGSRSRRSARSAPASASRSAAAGSTGCRDRRSSPGIWSDRTRPPPGSAPGARKTPRGRESRESRAPD